MDLVMVLFRDHLRLFKDVPGGFPKSDTCSRTTIFGNWPYGCEIRVLGSGHYFGFAPAPPPTRK